MQIKPVNTTRINPIFTSRSRMDQDNVAKLYCEQIYPLCDEVTSINRSLLNQRFNYNEIQNDRVSANNKTYDSFTGLRDKNYLLSSLYIIMQEAQRDNKNLSIAMFDMDNFKSINELLGYDVGDIFIKEISKDISSIAKDSDVDLYRFGGEEFILIFDGQTDEQKMKIAKAVAQRTNTNEVIKSYKDIYIKNAQSRLDKSLYSTAKIQKIPVLKAKVDTLKEVLENLKTEEAKNDPYFSDEINELTLQINIIYKSLIDECIPKEQDDKVKNVLTTIKSKLTSNSSLLKSEQIYLDEYLFSIYDKAHEIYQTKKWISDFKQNNGFGITSGVVNFEPDSLEYKSPMDIIEKAGKVLKKGKSSKKGVVYLENIKL